MCQPMLGIFWYDPNIDQLFGIVQSPEKDIPVDSSGKKTFSLLHSQIWEDARNDYYDQYGSYKPDEIYPDEEYNPYSEPDYTLFPRGRIFSNENEYQIYVGSWIYDYGYEHVKELIEETFNLPDDETNIIIAEHWEIGNGWGE